MNIISQNLKNILKNKIKTLISTNIYNSVDFIVDNFSLISNDNYNYFNFTNLLNNSVRTFILSVISSTFEEIDTQFKLSASRKTRYYINKSNVSRTISTIFGTVTFKRTLYKNKFSNTYLFFVDNTFNLPKYDHYDPIIKAVAINNAFQTSQAQSARDISAYSNNLSYFVNKDNLNTIPRQSIFNWIKKWNVPNVTPKSVNTPETLYVMADEKYIGAQDIDKDIMIKCFVTFEDVNDVSKNRRSLSNRFTFSTCSDKPWKEFMDIIAMRYDFSKIKSIALIGDGGSWIKSGLNELRLDSINTTNYYLCEFHFKQAIHHITSDKSERKILFMIFNNFSKDIFIDNVYLIMKNQPDRTEIIIKKLNYILNNYNYIKNMLNSKIGSSMESHISHLIASFFASRPKGYSTKNIKKYLFLNDYKNNNFNIFNLYLKTYKYKEHITINENTCDFDFDNTLYNNVPILKSGHITPTYNELKHICHH